MAIFSYTTDVPTSANIPAAAAMALRNARRLSAGLNVDRLDVTEGVIVAEDSAMLDMTLDQAIACGISAKRVRLIVSGPMRLS